MNKGIVIIVPDLKKLMENKQISSEVKKPVKLTTGEMCERNFLKKEKENFTNQLFEFIREKKIREFIEKAKERNFYTEELEKAYRHFAEMYYSKELLESKEIQELGMVLDNSFEKEMVMLFLLLEREKELKQEE